MSFNCRFCSTTLNSPFIDLGHQPPSNAYIPDDQVYASETYLPLAAYVCPNCRLVQVPEYASANELFTKNYAYFSSTSTTWLKHSENYCRTITQKLGLNKNSFVVELASNDGYLLKNFVDVGIPCLGVEPTKSTAEEAHRKGIPTIQLFFGQKLASDIKSNYEQCQNGVDLVVANNVLAHVPDINDFVGGIAEILKPTGVVTIEFPHLLNLLKYNQFDTIYHEHYSYFSLETVRLILDAHGLSIYDVEQISTHGGSLRIYASKKIFEINKNVKKILDLETQFFNANEDSNGCSAYTELNKNAKKIKYDLLSFLMKAKLKGQRVIGFGAAAKGNTLLNFCGIRSDLISCIFDNAKSKQGQLMPGSRIPILNPNKLDEYKPDYILVLPWNLIDEIKDLYPNYKLVTAVPELKFWNHE